MHSLGKAVMMVAVIIVVIAIFINFSSLSNTAAFRKERNIPLAPPVAEPISPTNPASPLDMFQGKNSFDLNGPLVCNYTSEGMTASVRILNKNIYLKHTQKDAKPGYVVVNDGTLYLWEQGSYEGQKVSNVGQYLNLFDSFSMFMTPDMLFSLVPQVNENALTQDQISMLTDSCEKQEVDDAIFAIPSAVKFTETDMQNLDVPEGLEEE